MGLGHRPRTGPAMRDVVLWLVDALTSQLIAEAEDPGVGHYSEHASAVLTAAGAHPVAVRAERLHLAFVFCHLS